jgi:ribosomal protein L10
VSLTKTGAKGKTLKAKLIEVLREHMDEYERIYVFSFENMRTARFRDVRMDWKESK